MRKNLLCFVILSCASVLNAGVSLDSLKSALTTAQGPERGRILIELTEYYRNFDPERTLFYAGQADSVLQQYPDTLLQIRLLRCQSTATRMLARYMEALEFARKSLELSQAHGDSANIMKSLNSCGLVYWNIGQLELAQKYFIDALKIAEALHSASNIATTNNNLALIYTDLSDFEKAQQYFLTALKESEKTDNPGFTSILCLNLGNIYNDTGELEKGLEYYNRALEINLNLGDRPGEASVYSGISVIYQRQKKYDSAVEYGQKALAIFTELNLKSDVSRQLCNLADVMREMKRYRESLDYSLRGLAVAQEIHSLIREKVAYKTCAEAYQAMKQYEEALDYYQKYQVYSDSVFSVEQAAKTAEFEIIYQVIRKEKEIELLKLDRSLKESEIRRQRSLKYASMASAVIFLLMSALTLFFVLQKDKLNRRLRKSLLELQAAMDEIKTLKGLIPICANCKKIRNDQGFWEQIEQYIADHSEAEFTHGICPECAKELYPEFYQKKWGKEKE